MKTPQFVGSDRGPTRAKKVRISRNEVIEKDTLMGKGGGDAGVTYVSDLESGDKPSNGCGVSILKLRHQNARNERHVENIKISSSSEIIDKHENANAKKPPKFSSSRTGSNCSKTKLEDNDCTQELNYNVENTSADSPDLCVVGKDASPSTCHSSPILMEQAESPEVVAPPPPGYFIRDNVSTDDEQTTICCNQNGDKILDNVPLCTFGYKGWSSMPYYYEISPDCDSNYSPYSSHSQSPVTRKKEPSTKKPKKIKKRKRSTSKIRDNSDSHFKKFYMDGNVKPKSKLDVDLKKGIALKQGSKKETAQTLSYKQRVINPKNPKLFQTMGNLPVSMDSVLYYYEPHGKQIGGKTRKKTLNQGKNNSKKICKRSGSVGSKKRQTSNKGKQEDILYLNTNGNANTSDIDLSDVKNIKSIDSTPAQSCTRQNGNIHIPNSYDTDLSDTVGNVLPGDYSSIFFEDLDSDFKRKFICDAAAKDSAREAGELGKATESQNGPFSIDAMIEDSIQNAFKEESEYEQSLMAEKPESISKHNEDDALTHVACNGSIVNMQSKSHKTKKSASSEKDKSKMQERSLTKTKVTNPKMDTQTSLRQMKKKSLSTPNIAVVRTEKEDSVVGAMDNDMQSPMTAYLQAQKDRGESETMLCRSQTSPQLAYTTVGAMKMEHISYKQEAIPDSIIDDNLTPQFQEDDCVDTAKPKERGRMKKSGHKTNSILRKPTTSSPNDKRTGPQSIKANSKPKHLLSFTKSHSLSPVSKKRGVQIYLGQAGSRKSKESNEVSKKVGKKTKKKVRIVVDVNGIQPDKTQADDDFCEFRDDIMGQHSFYDGEIDDNHAYLAGLLEKCKSENEQGEDFTDEQRKLETAHDSDTQHDKGDSSDMAYCGFSETNSDQESLPCSPRFKEITPCIVTRTAREKRQKKTQKQIEKEHKEKHQATEKERLQAEKGWDNNFVVQKEDSKTKVVLKKKRYQLKKASDQKSEVDDMALLEKLKNSTDVDVACRKAASQTGNKIQKGPNSKKRAQSPKQYSKRGGDKNNFEQDPREGTSVDAPGFSKRELGVRATKSGQSVSISKQNPKESLTNATGGPVQAQRVKMARDNFSKFSRKKSPSPLGERYTSSMVDQVSPMASRSTDLDVAFSYRRQQLSPGRMNAIGRLARRDSKLGHGTKFRSKSESEEYKQKIGEACSSGNEGSGRWHNSDPMDMNVLNLGLSWMIQGLMKRFSIFNKKDETEESMASPEHDNIREAEEAQI